MIIADRGRLRQPVRAVLIGDCSFATQVLRERLATVPGLVIAGEASTAEAAMEAIAASRPRLVFVRPDHFPDLGIDLCRSIRKRFPATHLLIVTHRTELDALCYYASLGVMAYLYEDTLAELTEIVEAVLAGRAMLGRPFREQFTEFLATPLGELSCRTAEARHVTDTTGDVVEKRCRAARRQAVVALAAQGLANKEIAKRLGMKPSTVAEHLRRHRAAVGSFRRIPRGRRLAEGTP